MRGLDLLLVVDPVFDAGAVETRVRTALSFWHGADWPKIRKTSTHDFVEDERALEGAAAVWLILEDEGSSLAYQAIGLVQENRLPAVLSLTGGDRVVSAYEDGVVSCPLDADPGLLCSVIRSLWSQAPVLADLRREIKLLRAHESGLCGQIAQLDEELRMAAQLQKEFMPTDLPSVGGVCFDVLWRPAGYVSGDIYDVIRLDETHIGLFIADAVGHGVPAALMTVHIKRSMPTKLIDESCESGYRLYTPGEAIGILNQEMLEHQTGKVRFATACYGIIDTQTNRLTIARAGHPFPLILRADGHTETIEPEGGLLGVFPDEKFEEATIQLNPGDRVLLYSDGFEVAFDGSEEETKHGRKKLANDQYAEEFEDLRNGNAEAALDRLAQRLNMQSGSLNQRDDLTIVCLSVTEPAAISAQDTPSAANAA
ncbi:MAG: PP2C family protein-serine/threonine phosphatase [Phycisphaerales bacterium]